MRFVSKSLITVIALVCTTWGAATQAYAQQEQELLAEGLKAYVSSPEARQPIDMMRDKEARQRVLWSIYANKVDQHVIPMLHHLLEQPMAEDGAFSGLFAPREGARSAVTEIEEFVARKDGFVQASALSSVPGPLEGRGKDSSGYLRPAVSLVSVNILDRHMTRLGGAVNISFAGSQENLVMTPWLPLPDLKISEGAAIAHAVFVVGDFEGHLAVKETYESLHIGFPRSIHNQSPAVKAGQDQIVFCLDRANGDERDCTYGPTHDPQRNIVIPLQGRISLNHPVRIRPNGTPIGSITAELRPEDGGGHCSLIFELGKSVSVENKGMDLAWNIPQANFGNSCFRQGERMIMTLRLSVSTTNGDEVTRISNDPVLRTGPSLIKIPPMQVQFGCVAAGSLVTMADGSSKAIEQVVNGDRVLSRPDGPVLAVRGTVSGDDPAMIEIDAENGDGVQVTGTHPVITSHGPVMARDLRPGDRLITATGDTMVVAVQARPAARVYNLQLGAIDTAPIPAPDKTTFIANGILVGDLMMQRDGEVAARSIPANVAAEMRNSLYADDYENWTKRQH